jgi:hypothetical protein
MASVSIASKKLTRRPSDLASMRLLATNWRVKRWLGSCSACGTEALGSWGCGTRRGYQRRTIAGAGGVEVGGEVDAEGEHGGGGGEDDVAGEAELLGHRYDHGRERDVGHERGRSGAGEDVAEEERRMASKQRKKGSTLAGNWDASKGASGKPRWRTAGTRRRGRPGAWTRRRTWWGIRMWEIHQ